MLNSSSHPTIWKFINALQKEEQVNSIKIEQYVAGIAIGMRLNLISVSLMNGDLCIINYNIGYYKRLNLKHRKPILIITTFIY